MDNKKERIWKLQSRTLKIEARDRSCPTVEWKWEKAWRRRSLQIEKNNQPTDPIVFEKEREEKTYKATSVISFQKVPIYNHASTGFSLLERKKIFPSAINAQSSSPPGNFHSFNKFENHHSRAARQADVKSCFLRFPDKSSKIKKQVQRCYIISEGAFWKPHSARDRTKQTKALIEYPSQKVS